MTRDEARLLMCECWADAQSIANGVDMLHAVYEQLTLLRPGLSRELAVQFVSECFEDTRLLAMGCSSGFWLKTFQAFVRSRSSEPEAPALPEKTPAPEPDKRPSCVPAGAPWDWISWDGLPSVMWVAWVGDVEGSFRVFVHDPTDINNPWRFRARPQGFYPWDESAVIEFGKKHGVWT